MSMRSFSRAGITRRLFNTPLAVLPSTAAIVLGAVGPRFDVNQLLMHASGEVFDAGQLQAMAADERNAISAKRGLDQSWPDLPAARVLDIDEGVAHINVRGELVAENGGGVSPSSGFTGYDAIGNAWSIAQRDAAVRGVLLDINTPGGEVTDLFELTAMMMADRGRKPTRAIVRGLGASAGYAIACCCDEITVQPLSYTGSIGVITMHADFSGQLAQEGIKVTLITAGAHKADANPFEALPDEVRAAIQADIDHAYGMFTAHVATARGLDDAAVRATEARVFQGEQALGVRLADKVMSWRDSQAEFVAAVNGRTANTQRKASPAARASMETKVDHTESAPAISQPGTTTDTDASTAAVPTQMATDIAAIEASATAERTRVLALVDLCPTSNVSASLRTAISGGQEAGAFAIGLATEARSRGASLTDLAAGAVQKDQIPAPGANAIDGTTGTKPKTLLQRMAGLGHKGLTHLNTVG